MSSHVAQASTSGGPGSTHGETERSDQTGGDMFPIITKLAAVAPSGAGEMPVAELLPLLKAADPTSFAAVDHLSQAARQVAGLSDEEAGRWKAKGNAEFQKGVLQESVLSYTHGLLSACENEMTATLLNNRSTVLHQQRRFADACLDAHRAFELKPDYWKALMRRGRCLEELGFRDMGAKDVAAAESEDAGAANTAAEMQKLFGEVGVGLVELALPPRATLEAPVRVERSAKGRGLVARERLDAGVTILTETPFALVACAETLLSVCSYCLQFTSCLYHGEPFRAHGTKSRGFFCSAACAEAAWRYYGERESANPFFLCCPNDALLAWRLLHGERTFAQLAEMHGFDEAFDPVSHNRFGAAHMQTLDGSHSQELQGPQPGAQAAGANPASLGLSATASSVKGVGGYESVVACLALHMGAVTTPAEAERLRKAQRQILLNAYEVNCMLRLASASAGASWDGGKLVTSNTTVQVGKAMYAVGSLVNHACDPNCFASFMNNPQGCSPMLVLRTVRPVMEGEELTVAYGGIDKFHFHSMRHRLCTLRDRYGFVCRCPTCTNQVDEPVKEADKEAYIKASDYYQKGRRMIREGKFTTAVTVLLQSYEIVMRDICPPPQKPQVMVPKTHDALALAYFHLGNRAKCVEHLKAALATDIEVHEGNANRVELINEYTRLSFVMEATSEAAQAEKEGFAQAAVTLLRRFYAPSPMLELQVAYVESGCKRPEEKRSGALQDGGVGEGERA